MVVKSRDGTFRLKKCIQFNEVASDSFVEQVNNAVFGRQTGKNT